MFYYFTTQAALVRDLVLAVVVLVTSVLTIYAVNVWILTLVSVRGRNKVPAPPSLTDWPAVSINVPLYNERKVASRVLEACVNLDYPRDKLEIVVVDDSADETRAITADYAKRYPGLVKVIRRPSREGFKAGALQTASRNSSGEFIALFDADYVPPSDFLKKMIPYLRVDDRVGFVQARWSYLDGGFSWIARAIALGIDVHAFIDQRARYAANLLAHFSGTCGVFRRKAIEEVGGWNSDTLAEDLDLSIRLHMNGWKYIYVPSVVCPGEIPATYDTLKRQQFRWAKGFSQCLRKYGLAIIRTKNLSLFQKIEAIIHLGTYFVCPLTIISAFVAALYYTVFPLSYWLLEFWRYKVALLTFALSLFIYTAPLAASWVTIMETARSSEKLKRFFHLGYLGAVAYGLLLSNTKAVLEGLLATPSYFYRTPKVGFTRPRDLR